MKQGKADKTVTAYKTHPVPHAMSPRGVSQYGYATGGQLKGEGRHTSVNTALPVGDGKGYAGPNPSPQRPGPGGGRTVHRSGSQGRH
jgi:hypothetical protein